MIDFIRSIQPQLMTLVVVILVVTIVFIVLKKNVNSESMKVIKKVYWSIIGLSVLIFLIFILAFSSINEVPRSEIDDSVIDERESYFEKESKKILEEKKEEDSTNQINY